MTNTSVLRASDTAPIAGLLDLHPGDRVLVNGPAGAVLATVIWIDVRQTGRGSAQAESEDSIWWLSHDAEHGWICRGGAHRAVIDRMAQAQDARVGRHPPGGGRSRRGRRSLMGAHDGHGRDG